MDTEGFIIHRRARAGGPRCGFREPLDKLRGSWGEVTCPACLAGKGQPEETPEAVAGELTPAGPAGGPGGPRRPKRPEELPPQLIALAETIPRLICAAAGRDVEAVRLAFVPKGAVALDPALDPVLGCAVAIATAVDWYLPDVLDSPAVAAGVAVVGLSMAIKMTPKAPKKAKEGEE